jgi:hypothetical protein
MKHYRLYERIADGWQFDEPYDWVMTEDQVRQAYKDYGIKTSKVTNYDPGDGHDVIVYWVYEGTDYDNASVMSIAIEVGDDLAFTDATDAEALCRDLERR